MEVDKIFAMNSFLTYRTIVDPDIAFSTDFPVKAYPIYKNVDRKKVYGAEDTFYEIKTYVKNLFEDSEKKVALMLSGGIDSAILAALVPEGTKAYTFKTMSTNSVDDVVYAKKYAKKFKLDHEVIDVTWEDYDKSIDDLMKLKGSPIHSIEPQIYKAAKQAKSEGFTTLLFGENADIVFGGFNGLLSKDWTLEEFYQRYCFVDPSMILVSPQKILYPIEKYSDNENHVDVHHFVNDIFYKESNNSYFNACTLADIEFSTPFSRLSLGSELDLNKIRSGQNKYILRQIFSELYPEFENRKKIPMPRAVDTWFADWQGPIRGEFLQNVDMSIFTGDQKWMLYVLERFLNLIG
ncbi:asparagine synthase [Enterococcus sp. MJM12]|uniref:asparagine synthase (glutamine-hydrolyzing) n=1 Tax=Candidatus Enterococcus myersii TaxID=2815322 RepID=A0ABS3H462_9ENTE|nr:asparagine synthase C-terminal domain-containing protein [Enterococcus sp. MJM12]MBO0448189.1 asparagine synthase [Enterococcus sp. MJM12]